MDGKDDFYRTFLTCDPRAFHPPRSPSFHSSDWTSLLSPHPMTLTPSSPQPGFVAASWALDGGRWVSGHGMVCHCFPLSLTETVLPPPSTFVFFSRVPNLGLLASPVLPCLPAFGFMPGRFLENNNNIVTIENPLRSLVAATLKPSTPSRVWVCLTLHHNDWARAPRPGPPPTRPPQILKWIHPACSTNDDPPLFCTSAALLSKRHRGMGSWNTSNDQRGSDGPRSTGVQTRRADDTPQDP